MRNVLSAGRKNVWQSVEWKENVFVERREKIFLYVGCHLGVVTWRHMVVLTNTKWSTRHHGSYQISHCAQSDPLLGTYMTRSPVPTARLCLCPVLSRMI